MGQQEVSDFLKKRKNNTKQYTAKEISKALKVSIGSVTMSLKKLRERKQKVIRYKEGFTKATDGSPRRCLKYRFWKYSGRRDVLNRKVRRGWSPPLTFSSSLWLPEFKKMPRPDLTRTEEYREKTPKERKLYVLGQQKKIMEKNIKVYKELIPLLEKELRDINKIIKELENGE